MVTLFRILTMFAVPLGLLNMLGGLVAGIWLAVMGKWGLIGWGFAFMIFSTWGLSFAMAPGMLLAVPIARLYERGRKALAYPLIFLVGLYNAAVITVWCVWTLFFFIRRADDSSLIPTLLWAYGAATGPLSYMTQQEGRGGGDNTAAAVTTYFAQLGFVAMVIVAFFAPLYQAILVFACIMAAAAIFNFAVAVAREKEIAEQGVL